jgi:hypothetical protein
MDLKLIQNGDVCALCGVGDSHSNPLPSLLLLPFCGVLFHPTLRGEKRKVLKGNLVFEKYARNVEQIKGKVCASSFPSNMIKKCGSGILSRPGSGNLSQFRIRFWIKGYDEQKKIRA